jgi:hypothetical protein
VRTHAHHLSPLHHGAVHTDTHAYVVNTKGPDPDGGLTTRELATLLDGSSPLDNLANTKEGLCNPDLLVAWFDLNETTIVLLALCLGVGVCLLSNQT